MDLRTVFPPKQDGKTLCTDSFSAFGLSLQGASHADKEVPVPCQDYSDFRYLEQEDLFIAAIADGVGSCELSHWGAYTAVCAVLDSVEAAFKAKNLPSKLILETSMGAEMKKIMLQAFRDAQDAVERKADEGLVMPALCMSTLTLAIYDGENLYFGHVGDDGIVAQMEDGTVEMLTTRLKGEEASSVYPLQSGEQKWKFGRAAAKVVGFVMATDGVLDAFVTNRPDYYNVNYNKGVFYPFMKDAMDMLAEDEQSPAEKAMEQYKQFMLSEDYRRAVTDDLTLVAVVSNRKMKTAQRPKFNVKIWEVISAESKDARKLALRRKPIPLEGLAAMQGSKPAEVQTEDTDYLLLMDENARLKDQLANLQSKEEEMENPPSDLAKSTDAGAKKKGLLVAAGVAVTVAALLAGVLVGRTFFSKISDAEYNEIKEAYELLQDENRAASEQQEIIAEELAAAEQRLEELQQIVEKAEAENRTAEEQYLKQEEQIQLLMEESGLTAEDILSLIAEKKMLEEMEATVVLAQSKAEMAVEAAIEAEAAAMDASEAMDPAIAAESVEKAKNASINAANAAFEAEQAATEVSAKGDGMEAAEDLVTQAKAAAITAKDAKDRAMEAYNQAMLSEAQLPNG